jgi:hypothetical protein
LPRRAEQHPWMEARVPARAGMMMVASVGMMVCL